MAAELRGVRVQQGAAGRAGWRVRLTWLAFQLLFRLFFRLRVKGRSNIPRTPVIICANHLGWMDVFLIIILFPVEPRIYVLGEHESVVHNDFRARVVNFYE